VECAFPEDFAAVHVGDVFESGFNQLASFLNCARSTRDFDANLPAKILLPNNNYKILLSIFMAWLRVKCRIVS